MHLQCVLAARILIVDFVVCALAVEKEKSGQVSTCRIGPFPCKKHAKDEREVHVISSIEEIRNYYYFSTVYVKKTCSTSARFCKYINVKLSLCLTDSALCHEDVCGCRL
jgi:hypothetical protein